MYSFYLFIFLYTFLPKFMVRESMEFCIRTVLCVGLFGMLLCWLRLSDGLEMIDVVNFVFAYYALGFAYYLGIEEYKLSFDHILYLMIILILWFVKKNETVSIESYCLGGEHIL